MKIDVTQLIYNIDDSPFKADREDGEDLTLRHVLLISLTRPHSDDASLSADQKIQRDRLAREIFRNDCVNMPVGDIADLQELINRTYLNPSIVAQAFALLDPDSVQPPESTE